MFKFIIIFCVLKGGEKILWWERNSYEGGKKLILQWKETHMRVERNSYDGGKETHIGTVSFDHLKSRIF